MGMFIAATDNTGVIMGMIMYCLAKFPNEERKVREELDKLVSSPDDLKHEDLNKMVITYAFIKECFRHYSNFK